MDTRPKTEREWWDLLSSQTPRSMFWKGKFDRYYASTEEYLRENHGIKNCIGYLGQHALNQPIPDGYFDGLNEIHPRALIALAQYGIEFKPFQWRDPPGIEPKARCCYGNSFGYQYGFNKRMREQNGVVRMSYVEGVAFGSRTEPVLHAWNSMGVDGNIAIDSTWYAATGWTRYLGLPFAEEEYELLRHKAYCKDGFHLLFKKDIFEEIEELLNDILEKRVEKNT